MNESVFLGPVKYRHAMKTTSNGFVVIYLKTSCYYIRTNAARYTLLLVTDTHRQCLSFSHSKQTLTQGMRCVGLHFRSFFKLARENYFRSLSYAHHVSLQ